MKVWKYVLIGLLIANVIIHHCGGNNELNYYATFIAAFAAGLYMGD